jgi:hypothetical protein
MSGKTFIASKCAASRLSTTWTRASSRPARIWSASQRAWLTGENTSSRPCQISTGQLIVDKSNIHALRSASVSSIQPCAPCRRASA